MVGEESKELKEKFSRVNEQSAQKNQVFEQFKEDFIFQCKKSSPLQDVESDNENSDQENAKIWQQLESNMESGQKQYLRSQHDFDQWDEIGEGGQGKVFKARNKLDGNMYAIKRINLDYKFPAHCERIIREVTSLSKLYHPNIVRYFQAWTEDVEAFSETDSDKKSQSSSDQSQDEQSEDEFAPQENSNLEIEFEEQDYFNQQQQITDLMNINTFEGKHDWDGLEIEFEGSQSQQQEYTEELSEENKREKKINYKKQLLFIQMEYCEGNTLKELIRSQVPIKVRQRLLNQILDALAYIHSHQLIHRDLKPLNIFLDKSDLQDVNAKLGDFGLALKLHDKEKKNVSQVNVSKLTEDQLTYGIGTALYCSPEQQGNTKFKYSTKSDMYSLGVIMFELNYQMKTEYERKQTILSLKNQYILPQDFEQKANLTSSDDVRKVILDLIALNPAERPTAKALLEHYKDTAFQEQINQISNPKKDEFKILLYNLFKIHNSKHLEEFYPIYCDFEEEKVITDNNQLTYLQTHYFHNSTYSFSKLQYEAILERLILCKLENFYLTYGAIKRDVYHPIPFNEYLLINRAIPKSILTDQQQLNFQNMFLQLNLERKSKFLFLDEKGVLIEFPNNLITNWARFLAHKSIQFKKFQNKISWYQQPIKRYSIQNVISKNYTNDFLSQNLQLSFDYTFFKDNSIQANNIEAEIIRIAYFSLSYFKPLIRKPTIHINLTQFIDLLIEFLNFDSAKLFTFYELLAKFQEFEMKELIHLFQEKLSISIKDLPALKNLLTLFTLNFKTTQEIEQQLFKFNMLTPQLQLLLAKLNNIIDYCVQLQIPRDIFSINLSLFSHEFLYYSGLIFTVIIFFSFFFQDCNLKIVITIKKAEKKSVLKIVIVKTIF